jgi:thiamine pyrophosphate-dependent acetolactate synthase large subunit-like protein
MDAHASAPLRRREVVARILQGRGETLVVSGLGSPTYDCAAAGDHPLNFYLWGAMGSALTTGLGLALAQRKRRVLVITGDGEMLMGLGSLATAAVKKPPNLAVVVLDNERYGETGMQATHTGLGLDLAAVAASAGFADARTVRDGEGLHAAIPMLYAAGGPVMAVIKVSTERDPLALPARDGTFLKNRFRQALLGAQAM